MTEKVCKRSRHRSRQSNEALLVSTRHHSVASFTAFGELKLHSLQKLKRAWFSLVCINLVVVVFTYEQLCLFYEIACTRWIIANKFALHSFTRNFRNSAGCLFKVTFADGVTYVEYANFVMATVGAGSARPRKTAALSVICYLAKAPPLVYEGRWMKPLGFRRRGELIYFFDFAIVWAGRPRPYGCKIEEIDLFSPPSET